MQRALMFMVRRLMVSRWRWPVAAGVVLVLVVFGIGLVSLGRTVFRPRPASSAKPAAVGGAAHPTTGPDGNDQVTKASEAPFSYLTPKLDPDWDYDAGTISYDVTKQLVKYGVKFHNNQVQLTISEQSMPPALLPRNSKAFMSFVNDAKPTRSQDVGSGTLYFLPALKNGALGAGSDTVIYATDTVLLFGRADQMVGYDPWIKLMGAMQLSH